MFTRQHPHFIAALIFKKLEKKERHKSGKCLWDSWQISTLAGCLGLADMPSEKLKQGSPKLWKPDRKMGEASSGSWAKNKPWRSRKN